MDSRQIEKKAILAIENYFIGSEVVHTYLADNDKEPFWDGHLYLYSSGHKTKNDFIGRIAVQVKGKVNKQTKHKEFSYPIKMSDLNAYSSEGTMFFVVLQNESENVIYYKSLTPLVICNVKKINKGKAKATVRLNPIPLNLKMMESELVEFFENCKKQISYAGSKVLNFEDLKKHKVDKLTFVAHGYDKSQHIIDFLSRKSVYMYAVMMDGINLEVPIGEGPMFLTFTGEINRSVTVKGKSYYNSYTSIVSKDSIVIKCGKCFEVEFPRDSEINEGKIIFTRHSVMLSEVINDLEFILDIINKFQLELGNQIINLKSLGTLDKKEIEDELVFFKNLKGLLQILACNNDLDVSKLTNEDYGTIDILLKSICNKEAVDLEEKETCVMSLHLSNIVIQLVLFKNKSGLFNVFNYFDSTIVWGKKYDNELKYIPSFAVMDKDMFFNCSNIPYHNIVPAYESLKNKNLYIVEIANLNLLEMLHAIDKIKKDDKRYSDFKTAINELASWIYENESKTERIILHRINKLQIVKRERLLSSDEKKELKKMLVDALISDMEKCAIYILLDDDEMVDIYTNRLSEDELNELKAYPIWNLKKKKDISIQHKQDINI